MLLDAATNSTRRQKQRANQQLYNALNVMIASG